MRSAGAKSKTLLHTTGLKELQKALKETSDKAPKAIQKAHKSVAGIVLRRVEKNLSGTTMGPRAKAFGTTRAAGIRFLGHKPKGDVKTTDALLQEFGGRAPLFGNRDVWNTVKPKNKKGYFVYPAVRDTRDEVMLAYGDALDKAVAEHWSQQSARQSAAGTVGI